MIPTARRAARMRGIALYMKRSFVGKFSSAIFDAELLEMSFKGAQAGGLCHNSPGEETNAPVSPHWDSHSRIEAWGDPLETPESFCRQSPEKRIRRGVDAVRSGCGGSRSGPASAARGV